jgi:hypothetical protein
MVDRVQRLIGHEFVVAHPRHSSIVSNKQQDGIDSSMTNGSAVRRRMTVQNARSNANNKDTIIEMNDESSTVGDCRRASGFLGKISYLIQQSRYFLSKYYFHSYAGKIFPR